MILEKSSISHRMLFDFVFSEMIYAHIPRVNIIHYSWSNENNIATKGNRRETVLDVPIQQISKLSGGQLKVAII